MLGTMQSRDVIEEHYGTAAAELGLLSTMSPADGWTLGVADALAWVLGRSEIAPVTLASVGWPSEDEVLTEHKAAEAVLYGRRDGAGRSRQWTAGVEHGLLWAVGGTERPPISTDTPTLRARSVMFDELIQLRGCAENSDFSVEDHEQLTGAVAALEWVLGMATAPPLSFEVQHGRTPGVEAIEDESDLADALRYPDDDQVPPASRQVSRNFAAGVDQALRWAQTLTDRSAL